MTVLNRKRVQKMRVLDIDLDLFLWRYDGNPHDREDNTNVAFEEDDVRRFLEENCKLSKTNPTEGVLIQTHDEAFDYWGS